MELQPLQINVAVLDTQIVALEADVASLAQDARVGLAMLLDIVVEVCIDERGAVVDDGDLPTLGDDGHAVPFADGLVVDFLGRDDVIDGAGVLPVLESAGPALVVDELDLHALISGI